MKESRSYDVLIVGAGIMGATMASLLQQLEPSWRIAVVERLAQPGQESSGPWHNAGTGHSALCELNYTPETAAGIDITKAVQIHQQWQASLQFWARLVQQGKFTPDFITSTPHMSFVTAQDSNFLAQRFQALSQHSYFAKMEFSTDAATIASWAPLLQQGRKAHAMTAATRAQEGCDVNFGTLARRLLEASQAEVFYSTEVRKLKQKHELWHAQAKHKGEVFTLTAPFVFIGAGGATLPLLQKAGVKEARGYGGFPISGKFWHTPKASVVQKHKVKVYGKAGVNAPPMSVPHLDARIINGEESLLFGPFAGFSPKFLKKGHWYDLLSSVKWHNVLPMLSVAFANGRLVKYLVGELVASRRKKLAEVQKFYPEAHAEDWREIVAGQRVQVIKPTGHGKGELQFGTEVIMNNTGTMAGLLGASPGASTAVSVMATTLLQAFPKQAEDWSAKLHTWAPALDSKTPAEVLAATAKARSILNLS